MLNFFTPVNHLGYGVFSYNLLRAFDQHVSREIALFPIPTVDFEDEWTRCWIKNGIHFRRDAPAIMISPASKLNGFCGFPMIGFPIFEDEQLPERSLQIVSQLDAVLQPSHWGKTALEKQGIRNVHVVPGGYNPAIFFPGKQLEERLERIRKQGVSFVHIGKCEGRKSSAEILRTFCRANEGTKQRSNLLFHVYNPFDDNWLDTVRGILQTAGFTQSGTHFMRGNCRVVVPQGRIRREEVSELYQMADFGIWASKAEGWNLPLIECIASGLPCLTTDNTGQSEFIRAGIYPEELIVRCSPINPDGEKTLGRSIDEDNLVEKIAAIMNKPERFLGLGGKCLESIRSFTWEHSAKQMGKVLQEMDLEI
jgi:glycosyltransferase involved in cell wall biosynthesis